MTLYDLVMIIGDAVILSLIPLIVGLASKNPIRSWICLLVSALMFGVYVLIPATNPVIPAHYTSIYGGVLGSILTFVFLYGLSRRKHRPKRKRSKDKPNTAPLFEASAKTMPTAPTEKPAKEPPVRRLEADDDPAPISLHSRVRWLGKIKWYHIVAGVIVLAFAGLGFYLYDLGIKAAYKSGYEAGNYNENSSAATSTPQPTLVILDYTATDFTGTWAVSELYDSSGMALDDKEIAAAGADFTFELFDNGDYFLYNVQGEIIGQGRYSVAQHNLTFSAGGQQTIYIIEDANTLRCTAGDGSVTVMARIDDEHATAGIDGT